MKKSTKVITEDSTKGFKKAREFGDAYVASNKMYLDGIFCVVCVIGSDFYL